MKIHRFYSLLLGLVGLLLFIVSVILLMRKIEPIYTWFYVFAWWSYIAVIDCIVYQRKNSSLIFTRSKEFLAMIPWSIALWLFFEMVNLKLHNWHYINVPGNQWIRWTGYCAAYATVIPGIFETKDLLSSFGLFSRIRISPVSLNQKFYIVSIASGICFLFLPLLFPLYFFPLIWGSFILLCEPFLHYFRENSIVREWEQGRIETLILFLAAGFICGLFWELWNFWAHAKWIYTVPWVGNLKIFEMPVLGFLGFPLFAVEVYLIWSAIRLCMRKKYLPLVVLQMPVFFIYFYFCFKAIDLFTVKSFQ